MAESVYDFTVKDMDGNDVSLADYRGKVLLIVNTATGCEFTPQYAGLETLYEKYHDKGFEILDFPCNQFAGQAPGTNQEIHEFCVGHFAVTFKQFAKIDVNGPNEIPLYTYLKSQKEAKFGREIEWNFAKFLIDANGTVIERFLAPIPPDQIDEHIAKLLS